MKKRIYSTLLISLIFSSLILFSSIISAEDILPTGDSNSWLKYGYDNQRSGYSPSLVPNTNEIKWIFNTTTEFNASPAINNGQVIAACGNGEIYALNSTTGVIQWIYNTEGGSNSIWSSPAINSGRVFVGSRNNKLYCINESDGSLLWSFLTEDEIDSSPLI